MPIANGGKHVVKNALAEMPAFFDTRSAPIALARYAPSVEVPAPDAPNK